MHKRNAQQASLIDSQATKKRKIYKPMIPLHALDKEILNTIFEFVITEDLVAFASSSYHLYRIYEQHDRSFPLRAYRMLAKQSREQSRQFVKQMIKIVKLATATEQAQEAIAEKRLEWKKWMNRSNVGAYDGTIPSPCPKQEQNRITKQIFNKLSINAKKRKEQNLTIFLTQRFPLVQKSLIFNPYLATINCPVASNLYF